MADVQLEVGSKEHAEMMNLIYGDLNLQLANIMENDFFGVIATEGVTFVGEKLELSQDDHMLEIGSGIGGPAHFFAKKYGCKVTGIDISERNYRVALIKTKEAGLEHLVNFVHGNALNAPFPDQSFSHVFGCDAWCYFPDKVELYKTAYGLLKPGGIICFLEAVHESPRRYLLDKLIGRFYLETISGYISKLKQAGFDSIEYFDATELGRKDIISRDYKMLRQKNKIESLRYGMFCRCIEADIEILGLYAEGKLSHCFITAQKK